MLHSRERQEKIRDLLAAHGRLDVTRLATEVNVTAMTIRRDLAAMERDGLLLRTHGGCVLQSPFAAELSFPEKQRRRQAQKIAIARKVAACLKPNESIYLDTGTTLLQVARALPPHLNLRVFTNNLRIAMELFGRAGVEVVVYGGALARRNPDLAGETALGCIAGFRVDVAVLGGDALDVARGEFYGADIATAALSRAARGQAGRAILAMDSSKFGKRSLAATGRLGPDITLVTDDEASPKDRAALRATGATLFFTHPISPSKEHSHDSHHA